MRRGGADGVAPVAEDTKDNRGTATAVRWRRAVGRGPAIPQALNAARSDGASVGRVERCAVEALRAEGQVQPAARAVNGPSRAAWPARPFERRAFNERVGSGMVPGARAQDASPRSTGTRPGARRARGGSPRGTCAASRRPGGSSAHRAPARSRNGHRTAHTPRRATRRDAPRRAPDPRSRGRPR